MGLKIYRILLGGLVRYYLKIRKATNELTKEFQDSMDSPVDILNKTFEQKTSPRVDEPKPHDAQENSITDEKLLTYEDEIPTSEESPEAKADDPLG